MASAAFAISFTTPARDCGSASFTGRVSNRSCRSIRLIVIPLPPYWHVPLWHPPEQHRAPSTSSQPGCPLRAHAQRPLRQPPVQHFWFPFFLPLHFLPGTLQLTIGIPASASSVPGPTNSAPVKPAASTPSAARRFGAAPTSRLSAAKRFASILRSPSATLISYTHVHELDLSLSCQSLKTLAWSKMDHSIPGSSRYLGLMSHETQRKHRGSQLLSDVRPRTAQADSLGNAATGTNCFNQLYVMAIASGNAHVPSTTSGCGR